MPYKSKIGPKTITVSGNVSGATFNNPNMGQNIIATGNVCGASSDDPMMKVADKKKPKVHTDADFFNELHNELAKGIAREFEVVEPANYECTQAEQQVYWGKKVPKVKTVNHPIYGYGVEQAPVAQYANEYYGAVAPQAEPQDCNLLADKLLDAIEFYCNEENLNSAPSRQNYLAKIREIGMLMGIYKP